MTIVASLIAIGIGHSVVYHMKIAEMIATNTEAIKNIERNVFGDVKQRLERLEQK